MIQEVELVSHDLIDNNGQNRFQLVYAVKQSDQVQRIRELIN